MSFESILHFKFLISASYFAIICSFLASIVFPLSTKLCMFRVGSVRYFYTNICNKRVVIFTACHSQTTGTFWYTLSEFRHVISSFQELENNINIIRYFLTDRQTIFSMWSLGQFCVFQRLFSLTNKIKQ